MMGGRPPHVVAGLRGACATLALTALGLVLATAPAQACPGAAPSCPYTSASQIGQRGGGVLRFPQTVAIGPDGAIYVGDQSSHVVQVFSPDGRFAREVGIAGSRAGELDHVGAIAVAPDNTLLVADGANRIDRFDPSGKLIGSFGTPGAGLGQFHFGAGGGNTAGAGGGLAVQGNTLFVSDSANDRIQRFNLDGSGAREIVAPGLLAYPRGLVTRGNRLLVADDQNHRLAVFDINGKLIRTLGRGEGSRPGQFSFPYGVAFDRAGRLFVADDMNQRVVRLGPAPSYKYKARWGSYGTGPGQLAFPRAIATDAYDLVYVTNTGNDRIDVFTRSGRLVRSFGSSGRASGQFNGPVGVASDASGIRGVADSINGRVQFLNADGSIATVWGSPNPGPTIILRPVAVAYDQTGNAYVLDQRRSKIFVFSRSSGLPVRTIGSRGSGPGKLLDPAALAIDDGGTIHVADSDNQRIARFSTGGNYLGATTGTGVVRGIAVTPDGARTYVSNTRSRITVYDPSGTEITHFGGSGKSMGRLNAPQHLTLDAAGTVWVADRGNNRIQQFGPNGEKLLTFGVKGTGPGEFVRPMSVDISCLGTLTVGDRDNNRVQQFKLTTPVVRPCRALGALGNPPRPKTPTLPSPPGPLVDVKTLSASGLFTRRKLALRIGCDTICTVTVTGTLTQRNKPRGKRKRVSVSLRRVRVKLPAAKSRIVRLQLSRSGVRRLRRALHGSRGMVATLQITARAPAGEPTEVSKRLRVRG